MEKYNSLRDSLNVMLANDPSHGDIILMLQRDLAQVHKVEGLLDDVIKSLWNYALLAQKVNMPDKIFLIYVGCIIEFERECEALLKASNSEQVLASAVKAKRTRVKSPQSQR